MKISTQTIPAFASPRLARLVLGVGVSTVGIAISSLLLPQATWAQSTNARPLEELTTPQGERDAFTGKVGGAGGFSVFDLIHNARLGTRDVEEVIDEQREDLDNAAAEYRRRLLQQVGNPQLQQLGEPQPESPAQSPANYPTNY